MNAPKRLSVWFGVGRLSVMAALTTACTPSETIEASASSGEPGSGGSGTAASTVGTATIGSESSSPVTSTVPDTSSDGSGATTDATGEPGCSPSDACLPAVDAEWSGPVVRRESHDGGAAAACDGPFATLAGTLHNDLLAPPAACSCECGAVGEPSCEDSTELRRHAFNNCGGAHEDWDITAACNSGVEASPGADFLALNVRVEGVTCEPASSEEIIPAAFARTIGLCEAPPRVGSCADSGVCAPMLDADEPACIWRDGDFPCPEAWGQTRHLDYRSFIDERRCTECTCDEFYGTCTGVTILLFGSNGCNEQPIGGVTPGSCAELGNQGATAARRSGAGTPVVDCSGNAEGGVSVGSAGPTSPVTVCCVGE